MAETHRPMEDQCAPYRTLLTPGPYATIVPSRMPTLRFHSGIGQAKTAVAWELPNRLGPASALEFQGVCGGEIHRWGGGQWRLLYRVEEGTMPDELPWHVDGDSGKALSSYDPGELDCE